MGQSKSKKLYAVTKKDLVDDQDSLLELHRQNYPDSEIEERLCGKLSHAVADDSRPSDLIYRKSVVESLRDHGTESALLTLEVILRDQKSKLQEKKVVSSAIPKIEIECEEEFVSLLRNAIQSIKNRGEQTPRFETNDKAVGDVFEYQQKASDQLGRGEFDEALGTARKAAEAISADIYVLQGIEKESGKSPYNLKLQLRIEAIKPHISDLVYSHLKAIQVFGNVGTHHREDDQPILTSSTVKAVLSHLDELAILFKEFREDFTAQEVCNTNIKGNAK